MGKWHTKKPTRFKFENPGDKIQGQITGCRDTEFGKSYQIKTTDNQTMYFFGSTSLDRQLEDCVGSIVKITYLGEVKTKGGRMMRDYEVAVWNDDEEEVDDDAA
jgi:hypothetical protein